MSETLMESVEVELTPHGGGLLGTALQAPQGWIQGLAIPFYGCGEPALQNYCVTANDTPHRPNVVEFHPFGISQGASCSTLSQLDQSKHAEGRLDATTEWAVARQLASNELTLDTTSFADATSAGAVVANADFVKAVSILEQAAADAGFGTQWWLHAPVRAAAYLADSNQLVDGKSATGAPWVISPGYPVQNATTVRLWATGPVWVGVADSFVVQDVNWHTNEDTAYASREAIAAYDPCVNLYIDVTV